MSMDWFGDLLGLGLKSLIGFGFFFGLVIFAINSQAEKWRALAARYAQAKRNPVLARKLPETIVISKSNGAPFSWGFGIRQNYAQYTWTIISVLEDGLMLSAIPPVNMVCKDIYLPFDEMKMGPHPWMLWKEPYAISMDNASDLVVIIGQDTLQWLRQNAGRAPFCH